MSDTKKGLAKWSPPHCKLYVTIGMYRGHIARVQVFTNPHSADKAEKEWWAGAGVREEDRQQSEYDFDAWPIGTIYE